MDRTRIKSCVLNDRITNLPCDIIDNILKYLPLRDVVRTSILSRGWRYKWVTIPYLVFDENFQESLPEKCNIESIIYQILLVHKGPIIKFTLMVPDFEIYPAIDHWLHFLSNHHVEEFALWSSDMDQPMPYHLFNFDHLRHLYLIDGEIKLPPAFKGFSGLLRLELQNVYLAPWEFKKLISKCPSLEYMDLDDLDGDTRDLEIDAPNLKSFSFIGRFNSICFKNASHLVKMSIRTSYELEIPDEFETSQEFATFEPYESDRNMIEVLVKLSSLTFEPYESDRNMIEVLVKLSSLESDGGFLQFLATGGVPQKLLTNLNHLTILSLFHIGFESIVEVKCALCLIRSSPNLQRLKITSGTPRKERNVKTTRFLTAQQTCQIPLHRLKNVKIQRFSGAEPEMEFLKLLLLAATVLGKLEISCYHDVAREARYCMVRRLVSFRRASPEAEIIFQEP
ncbi:F-box/FBD/LRR-repeat protein [Sesamum alatum]|uniref:F-box/FBD/LRR-repeat protein n=1 Tax=Sesamum alatum TaxID=300844 RepID=A0AAE1YQX7_9LAMI|nr:F-box/FBD/LRR-repeat protein [Sesamum alatum]